MRMRNMWIMGLCGTLLLGGYAGARDGKPVDPKKAQIKELQNQTRELRKGLGEIGRKLNLNKDEDLLKLKKAVSEANAAYRDAYDAKLKADPKGAELLTKIVMIEDQIKELAKKPPKQQKPKREKGAKKQQ
jgi:chromosome segregation ATPase